MRTTKTITLLLLSGVASVALIGQASALEAQAFVDRFATVYGSLGYDIEFGTATLDGDTITVEGATVSLKGPEAPTEPMTFDTELTFSGVTEGADGSYMVESLTIPDIDTEFAAEPTGNLSLADIELSDLYLPGGDTVPAVATLQLIGAISTGPLSVLRDGVEFFSYESFEAASTFNPAQGPDLVDLSSSMTISGIVADLSSVGEEDPASGAVIEALGLTNIAGDITQEMTWSMADGHMNITEFLFDFADQGALNLTADVTGLTPDVLEQFNTMQAGMAGGEMTEEMAQAQMMQGMAIMQGVSIVGATVRYDDAGLVGTLLDYYAAESGADRASFVEGLKSALPAMVAQSGIPALTDVVVPPVSAFLDNPESLEIKVAPPSPTSALVLMAAAANPAGLITALGLVIEANMQAE
ncbi:hypothetical protein [Devosia beringensis]|uniref:hypothetical protein n=1 Tax=Devosia beringensis TaxID=2657486 RepID=UPI00186B81D4|nr:hypothetical protein [Devosia beringensis]